MITLLWKVTKVLFLPLLLIFMFTGFMYMNQMSHIEVHEDVHAKIYDAYNISSNVSIDYIKMTGKTTVSGKDYAEKCAGTPCQTLQEYNEIVSYNSGNIMVVLYTNGMVLLAIGILLFMQLKQVNIINTETYKLLHKHLEEING